MAYERRDFTGNAVTTTLASGINASVESLTLADATGWPDGAAGHFFIVVDPDTSSEEKIRCLSRSGTTITVVSTTGRGSDDTSAAAHSSGATVKHVFTALDADETNYTVNETVGKVTTAGDLLVADGVNSLTRHAKGANSTFFGVDDAGIQAYRKVAAADVAADVATQAELDAVAAASVNDTDAAGGILDGTYPNPGLAASVAGDGLAETSNVLSVNVDGSTLEISADSLRQKDGGTTLAKLAAAAKAHTFEFSFPGTQATSTGALAWRAPFAGTLQHVRLYCTTAPTGASLIVDLHKNGTTVYTTQANRPTIAAAANAETATTAPDVSSFVAGDRLTLDIDQVGSTVAGSDLVAVVYYVLA